MINRSVENHDIEVGVSFELLNIWFTTRLTKDDLAAGSWGTRPMAATLMESKGGEPREPRSKLELVVERCRAWATD